MTSFVQVLTLSCYELGDNPFNLIVEYLLVLYLITLSVRAYYYRIRIGYRLPPRLSSYYKLGDNPFNLIVEYLLVLYLIALSVRAYRLDNPAPRYRVPIPLSIG